MTDVNEGEIPKSAEANTELQSIKEMIEGLVQVVRGTSNYNNPNNYNNAVNKKVNSKMLVSFSR